ncbi:hypothetical protein FMEXI_778 [Fusarium mexicanum]|uniref:Uncharacterized protein n=1 Tax=Fusarium mexicanum TaxID=751941 RepID=A0A8H5NA71_9HYPO|nr:hypothetical protein FMEXI_778 [Fusarium mexicanum]
MPKPLESDPPLIDKDNPERLSLAALRLADDQPHEFLTYLRRVWNKNRHQIRQSTTKLLHDLKQLKVSCHDGNLHPLSKACHEDPYPWNFLTEIGCQYEAGDQFLTDLLLTIKKAWPANVKDPERVSRIYGFFLLRQDHKKLLPDGTYYRPLPDDENWDNFNTHELLLFNGKWIKPSSCFHHAPDYVQSNRVLTPVPAGTDPSSFEPLWICQFYHLVLRIPDFPQTWTAIINGLRALQSSTIQPSIQHVVELYRALNELQLSESERITIRLYPDLKEFFVGLVGVEEPTEKIMSLMTYWALEYQMRDLYSLLNCLVAKAEISIKPDELLPRRIFLGRYHGEKCRFIGTEDFFIPDDQEFETAFKDNLPLLDVTQEEIASLDPVFTWLGFKDRYLSKHVRHRIALYCDSPRTTTKADRGTLLNILRKGELLAVEGIQSEKLLLSRKKGSRCLGTGPNHDHGFTAPSTHPELFIPSSNASHPVDKLVVYVSPDKEERDLALFTTLPQQLMEWLMTDLKTQKGGTAPLLGVSLLKNVLTAPPNIVDALLTSEGVGRIRIIEVNLTTMRQEAAPQNTTSNGPADQPS